MSVRTLICAALAGLTLFAGGLTASASPFAERLRPLVVELDRPAQLPPKPEDASTARQRVVVDGLLMELPEWVIEGLIRNGTFIPVYPGTETPIDDPCLELFGLDCL